MIPYEKLEVGVHYWAWVKRNRSLAVVCIYHPWGQPKTFFVKGTDENIFNHKLEDYVFIAPCVAPVEVFDEISTLRISGQETQAH